MEVLKNKVEAVLFTTGRFMTADEIANHCSIGSVGVVRQALEELRKEYMQRNTALAIHEENNRWKLNIKKDYNYLTTKLLSESELNRPTQATLALIAYKQPVLQSEIIRMRGNTAYDHVKLLRESEFITSEKKGRTRLLRLAPRFFDYFDIVEDQLKSKFSGTKENEI